ncbi:MULTISPECIES: hypothetical protein [Aneurinibacillus]|jgi:hypothetical protein|uniref:Uncharacterized protein n=1 Tax=Aneurinibacillus thermoaerophilus TaxID=143495 RepID=A0A1G8EVI8_ANETH|nr:MULTISPECIES: hypothetical protein [Aneurinibacillus]AMA73347.1 hypothetical protein ACH33_11105 [Aneurinibacillus sp. XH2]MED0676004.1 hypothetical protein [Aneurinibacillus thermoaerophilus]MED0680550.1 hypothetical protein [Aneurinibacillus thermoaerophilus]MED0736287.1 hypothetical protein [Aneurinibacillus thermoaerophilus]MED0758058.1 hypothetical protein [Aneurinibacillus thermoaerophilus]
MKTVQEALKAGKTIELTELFDDQFEWDPSFNLLELLHSGQVKYNGAELTKEESEQIIKALSILVA